MNILKYRNKYLACLISLTMGIIIFQFTTPAISCTAFCINKNGKMLVGNTEDYPDKNAKIKCYPATSTKYGRIYISYLAWSPLIGNYYLRFAGVNDQGLMFDILLSPTTTPSIPGNGTDAAMSLTDNVLEECKNISEARNYLDNYAVSDYMEKGFPPFWNSGYQLFFADKNGHSMVYGGGQFIESSTNYNSVANKFVFNLPFDTGAINSYYRHTSALNMVKNIDTLFSNNPALQLSPEYLLPILERVDHRTGDNYSTVYAYVMDLTEGSIYFYTPTLPSIHNSDNFMNYTRSAVLNVSIETSQSAHNYNIGDLNYNEIHSDSGIQTTYADTIQNLSVGDTIIYPRFNVVPGSNLKIELTGNGDADLYLVFGDVEDGLIDYSSAGYTSDEEINVTVPAYASQAFIAINAYDDSSALNVTVDYDKSSYVPTGNDLVSYENQEFDNGYKAIYGPFDVKAGTQFKARTEPGSGNVNLELFFGTSRTDMVLSASSQNSDSTETIMKLVPTGKTKAFVVIKGAANGSECDLMVDYVKP